MLAIGKGPLDQGHPLREAVHGAADSVKKIEKFGDGDGLLRAGLAEDVCAFALAGDDESFCGEVSDGVACGHDCDAVSGGEFGEGGQLVAGLVGAGGDGVA